MTTNRFCFRIFLASIFVFFLTGNFTNSEAVTANSSKNTQMPPGEVNHLKIAEKPQIPNPPILHPETKESCILLYDDGVAFTFFPNWNIGDRNAIYFDPRDCNVPYSEFPFQITDVEFLLYNHAEVESTRVSFGIWTYGSSLSQGPQSQIYSSPAFTITTFYPDWAIVSFTDTVCVNDRFFFTMEYVSGEEGSIPSLSSDEQQTMVDTFYQWIWRESETPPWREWNDFWNEPDPGWLMLRLSGETSSSACGYDTGWVWLPDNGFAPSGMPDVDENQDDWIGRCGPVVVGNCLGWFGTHVFMGWIIPEFIDTLNIYLQTDTSGTEVHSMKSGIDDFLDQFVFSDLYSSIWPVPDFYAVNESLQVNQTVVLLLGFWWRDGEEWWRGGGHFVSVSGIEPESLKIALSDPGRDAAENGWPGRVRPPDHPPPPHDSTLHNDFQYVSHDVYRSNLNFPNPGNPDWVLTNYLELDPDFSRQYSGKNFPSEFLSFYQPAPPGTSFVAVVEYAVMIGSQQGNMSWETSCSDYAPSGMPDFDQRQDSWINAQTGQLTFCGPVAVSNSFWWLDSKFNFPPGSMGDGIDQFPLVRDYLDNLSPYSNWDDHDLWNVDHSATPWSGSGPPPATHQPFIPGSQAQGALESWGELIERLAWGMDTDGQRTGGSHVGTRVEDIDDAIEEWFSNETFTGGSSLSDSLCVKLWQEPSFALVETLTVRQGNVILLLGFWYEENTEWWRVGGHYVMVAGINEVQPSIALSDPFFDNAEIGAPGRVLSGWFIPHSPIPHTDSTIHNDPGNVSHDIYNVDLNPLAPAGVWGISDYPVNSDLDYFMEVFHRQNVPEEFVPSTQSYIHGYPINTVVEYAILIDAMDYRGDVNGDGSAEVGDVVFLINYLFRQDVPPSPMSAGDTNCDRTIEVGDITLLIMYLFRGGDQPRCCGP